MNQIITNGDSSIVEAQVHLVFVNEKGKPVKVPEIIFDNFRIIYNDPRRFGFFQLIKNSLDLKKDLII